MKARIKKGIAILLTAVMVLAMTFQSLAAPLSYTKPAATESGAAKITGTWSKDAAGNWSFNSQDGAAKDGWYYLNTTNKGTDYNWFYFTNGVMNTGWVQDKNDPSVWYYAGETKDSSEGGLVKGWVTDPRDGKKYYMDPSTGIMCYGWKQLNGSWYYFGEPQYANATHPFGAMYVNEKTPDGYYVGSSGIWGQTTNSGSSNRKPTPVTTYTVTFNMNGHGEQISSLTGLKSGSRITAPTAPTADGFAFGGWYKEAACTNAWSFETDTVTKNITLYAKWVEGITIAEILNKVSGGFPKEQNAWVADTGYKCYINDMSSKLLFRDTSRYGYDVDISKPVTKDGDNYVYEANWGKISFTMDSDSLISITWDSSEIGLKDYNGTYKAPATTLTFKAVYDTNADANTLTFYYDTLDHSGANITVYNNLPTAAAKKEDWGYNDIRSNVKTVVIDESVKDYTGLNSTAYMFSEMSYAENISGAEYLDVSNVTDMSYMFRRYGAISTVLNAVPNVSLWNTGKVTNMTRMFSNYGYNSEALTGAPDVSQWNTANVTDMSYMFNGYGRSSKALTDVPDVSGWNTESATNMSSLFNDYGIPSTVLDFTLDLSKWNVAKVTENSAYKGLFQNAGSRATTWSVTIPAKTGNKDNNATCWYVGDGTDTGKFIAPATDRQFTVATPAPEINNIADVLKTVEFPNAIDAIPENKWIRLDNDKYWMYTANSELYATDLGGEPFVSVPTSTEITKKDDSTYSCTVGEATWEFNMNGEVLASIKLTHSGTGNERFLSGTYRAPATPTTYTVTFDMQDHGTQIDPITGISGGSTITKPIDPSETGYTFGGWYKEAACTNEWKFDTDTVTSNTTIYAKWVANTYTVKFDANGGSGRMDDQPFTYDNSQNLSLNSFTREDYEFCGWGVSQTDTEVVYDNEATVKNLTPENGAEVTLYAIWRKTPTTLMMAPMMISVNPDTPSDTEYIEELAVEIDNDIEIPDEEQEFENEELEQEVPEIVAEVKEEEIVEENKEVIPEEQSRLPVSEEEIEQSVPEEEVDQEQNEQEAE